MFKYNIYNRSLFSKKYHKQRADQTHANQPHANQPHANQPHANQPHASKRRANPLWGNSTWKLFHVLCNICGDKFLKEVIYFITNLIYCIPCDTCKSHAKQYLSENNINSCSTPEELKTYLFNFHNHTNKLLDKPVLDISILDNYNNINHDEVFNSFDNTFIFNKLVFDIKYNRTYLKNLKYKIRILYYHLIKDL